MDCIIIYKKIRRRWWQWWEPEIRGASQTISKLNNFLLLLISPTRESSTSFDSMLERRHNFPWTCTLAIPGTNLRTATTIRTLMTTWPCFWKVKKMERKGMIDRLMWLFCLMFQGRWEEDLGFLITQNSNIRIGFLFLKKQSKCWFQNWKRMTLLGS